MSNQEDDIVDDWESLENHPGLDQKLQKMADDVEKELKKKEELKFKPVTTLNCDASPFIPFSAVRILKREDNKEANNTNPETPNSITSANSKTMKSLEEREAAYREARLRILGSANDEYEESLLNENG